MTNLFSCCGEKSNSDETQILTVLKRDVGKDNIAFDMAAFMNTRCFVMYTPKLSYNTDADEKDSNEKGNQYEYACMEQDELVWDDSKDSSPIKFLKKMNLKIANEDKDDDSLIQTNIEEDYEPYLFDFNTLKKHRNLLKKDTRHADVCIVCAFHPDDLYTYMNKYNDKKHNTFSVMECDSSHNPEDVNAKEFGLFTARYHKSKAVLSYTPLVRTLEHKTKAVHRNRIIVNKNKDVLSYDKQDDTWILTKIDKTDSEECIERYIDNGMWSGNETQTVATKPVMICDDVKAMFSDSGTLSENKIEELSNISDRNSVSPIPSLVQSQQSLFKHAHKVTLFTRNIKDTDIEPFWSQTHTGDLDTGDKMDINYSAWIMSDI